MLSVTIVWFGGQMTPSDAAAPLQSGPDPLLELPLLELPLELLLELLLPDRVSATTTRELSEATATSAPAPRSAYTSFDIDLSSRFRRPQETARFQFEAAPFAAIDYM
ncbi:MAG TPA: hypothetical protein VNY82_10775 [Steroidobacteraceae bacterium]|jgi:hypothetical protein|nr:hypothetical protein [Steroidobacteraceae bacterium]